jgi:hypothetical protein
LEKSEARIEGAMSRGRVMAAPLPRACRRGNGTSVLKG